FTVDTVAPSADDVKILGLTDDVLPSIGEIGRGGTTDDTTPTLHGTAKAGVSHVNIYDGTTLLGTAEVVNGAWSFTPKDSLDTGSHNFIVKGVDGAGNEGPEADSWGFVVNITAPDVPAITGVYDDQPTVTGRLEKGQTTDDSTPTVRGTGKAGEVIEVFVNGKSAGTVVVGADQTWELTVGNGADGQPLLSADGNYVITATATNPDNGRVSGSTGDYLIVLDKTAPTAPDVPKGHDDQGPNTGDIVGGGTTDDRTPTLSGGGEEPGSTITIKDGDKVIGETVVDKDGNWTWTPDEELEDGDHSITTTVTDPAGNESDPSDSLDFTIDSSKVEITITKVIDDQ
ncbi:Ig-like domain-containing protein, partial [Bartonella sp. LJL80]